MEIAKANIVRSEAGRDKGNLFFVLDVDGEYLLLADGKRRRAEDETGQDVQRYPLPALCRVGLNACEHE